MKRSKKFGLGRRLTLVMAVVLTVILAASFLMIYLNVSRGTEASANSELQALVKNNAASLQAQITAPLLSARSLASSFKNFQGVDPAQRRTVYTAIMEGVLQDNPDYLGVWACFGANALDGLDAQNANTPTSDATGRFIPYWHWSNGAPELEALVNYETPGAGDYYLKARDSGMETILEPYTYEIDGKNVLLTSLAVPVKDESGAVLGVVGVDVTLDALQQTQLDKGTYQSAYFYALSSSGIYFKHADATALGANLRDRETENVDQILAAVQQGKVYSYDSTSQKTGQVVRRMLVPLTIGNTGTPWALAAAVDVAEITATTRSTLLLLILTLAATLLITILVMALLLSRSVSLPIKLAAAKGNQYAEGDFSDSIPEAFIRRGDEIGTLAQSFDTLYHRMNELMASIKAASSEVSAGAKLISSSSEEMAQGATEQASAIEELSSSIEEIASQTKQNAENASQANELADHTRQSAEGGNLQMQQMLTAMEEINQASASISKIIKIIDDIAFQTNILALNAAVEAARAGEHGKGFAVVAQEVRSLAARSASAAKETTQMIEASIRKVDDGRRIAEETARSMASIQQEIGQVAQLIRSINTASGEQSVGIAQINQGIIQVSQVVQMNSATAQQSAATSEELNRQADTLESQVMRFKLQKAQYAEDSRAVSSKGEDRASLKF